MRRPWTRILLILLAVVLAYMLMVGLGLTGRHKGKSPKRILVLNDFEDPANDLQWANGGYVEMETSTENLTHGKRSAKARFLLAKQFNPTPTPGMAWAPAISLSHKSVTSLTEFDWSDYDTLNLDLYNPGDVAVTTVLELSDGRGFIYDQTIQIEPKKFNNAAVTLADVKKQRLDLTSMDSITFKPDVSKAAEPLELYLDYLRLEGDPIVVKKKKN